MKMLGLFIGGLILGIVRSESSSVSDCNCVECKMITSGEYKGNWSLDGHQTGYCGGKNGCLYVNYENDDKICACDPGPLSYVGCESKAGQSVINLIENGQNITQTNNFDSKSGVLRMDVPAHIATGFQQEFSQSTSMLHLESNTDIIKSNSSCVISGIPDYINVTDMAENFEKLRQGTIVWDNENKQTIYDMKIIKSVLGSEERKIIIPAANDLCNNEVIKKTENKGISKENYEKLINGSVVFLNDASQKKVVCTIDSAAIKGSPDACGNAWINPETGRGISMHRVSSGAKRLYCCKPSFNSTGCNCTDMFPGDCPCNIITDKKIFMDCYLKFWHYEIKFDASGRRKGDSENLVGSQVLTYNPNNAERSVKIEVPSHGDIEETTVLMHAAASGWWHGSWIKNNMLIKLGSTCHIQTLPRNIFPIDIAAGIKEIAAGNFSLKPDDEKKKHSILLDDEPLTANDAQALNQEIQEICQDSEIIKHQEVDVSEEEFQTLNDGGIIDLTSKGKIGECHLLTKAASKNNRRGCWRWPTPEGTGPEIVVHGLLQQVISVDCCSEGQDKKYCNCDQINDLESIEKCLHPKVLDKIVAITGTDGKNNYNNFESFIQKESSPGFQLEALPVDPSSNFPVATYGGVGAWINKSLIVCHQFHGDKGVDDGCYMMKSKSWTKMNNTILTDPLSYGGASAKYKSGPTGNEPGETWWIIGGDHLGTRTQEWNSVLGANPWNPPVLPVRMNLPCMVAINDREIFVTSTPLYEHADTNRAWIFTAGQGWKSIPSLREERYSPACGFLPNDGLGWIVVAGGSNNGVAQSSTEMLNLTNCEENDFENCAWVEGPDLGIKLSAPSMVTMPTDELVTMPTDELVPFDVNDNIVDELVPFGDDDNILDELVTMPTDELVLFGDDDNILAMNALFAKWEVVGKLSQPRRYAVVLTIPSK